MNRWVVMLSLLVLVACTEKDKIPSNVIQPEKMEKVMWDMLQADRFSAQYLARDSARIDVKKESFRVYDQVFQIHNIKREEFQRSFKFYMGRPDLFRKIFDSLGSDANRRRVDEYKHIKVE